MVAVGGWGGSGRFSEIAIRTKESNHKHIPHYHAIGLGHECRVHLDDF